MLTTAQAAQHHSGQLLTYFNRTTFS